AARIPVPVVQIEHILALLRVLRQRPGMFVGWVEAWRVQHYLNGLEQGLTLCGFEDAGGWREAVTTRRGWRIGGDGLIAAIERSGLTGDAVVGELVDIYIEMWEMYRDRGAVSPTPLSPGMTHLNDSGNIIDVGK
ncbi:MAG: hypothetical protein H7Y38_13145, partial [Armatimonadetes bacterium]|nr:hypothetical protein [Armatimonadota bacterium]